MTQEQIDEYEKLKAQKERRRIYMRDYMRRLRAAATAAQPIATPE